MRVLYVGVSERPIEATHVWPIQGWSARGIELTRVIYLPRTSDLRPAECSEVVCYPTLSRSKLHFPADALRMAKRLHAQNPFDLLVADDPMGSGLVGWQLKRRLGLPLVIHCHTDYFGHRKWLLERPYYPLYHLLARFLLARADRVHTISGAVALSIADLGISPERIDVSPPVVWGDPFELPLPDSDAPLRGRLLYVGYLVPAKGLDTLFRALRVLLDQGRDVRLTMVGDGLLRGALERQAAALGITDRVVFAGFTPPPSLAAFYREADLLVLPSLYEAWGIVLAEAAFCGLPAVASRVGGIPEVVREGQTGLLVPPGDVQALAAAVASLLGDPARAHRMGRRAWHLAREQFSSDRILDMWADIWRRAARRSSEGSQGVETT